MSTQLIQPGRKSGGANDEAGGRIGEHIVDLKQVDGRWRRVRAMHLFGNKLLSGVEIAIALPSDCFCAARLHFQGKRTRTVER